MRHPVKRLTAGLPGPWKITIDWFVTIVGAVLIVLAIKHWLINPYRIPSSSMEPTLHCARPTDGCEARFSDRVLACRICYRFGDPRRGDIVVFAAPALAADRCGAAGTYVKRLIGLPGDDVHEDGRGFIWVDGKRLNEQYVTAASRIQDVQRNPGHLNTTWHVPNGRYFFMGDNRGASCDSRAWGSVPRRSVIGRAVAVYWPPNRLSIR